MTKTVTWLLAATLGVVLLAGPTNAFAKSPKCGGPELTCPGKQVKVCNPKNGRCCCATAGTYH